MTVQHIQRRGDAWRYRRKVPAELRERLGKWEIVIPLGGSEAEALRRYPAAHQHAEQLLRDVARPLVSAPIPTALDLHRAAHDHLAALSLDPQWGGGEPHDGESLSREVMAEQIASRYPLDDEGHPVGVTPADAAILRALMLGARDQRPSPTLLDAKRQYLTDKVKDDDKWRKQIDRIFALVADVVELATPLTQLNRANAREVRDHLLDGRTASSAQRYLNTLKAALSHAARELEVREFKNPFANLPVEDEAGATPAKRKREALTEAEATEAGDYIRTHGRADLSLIWRLVKGTGCRLAEVAGLRRLDVHLDHATPHLSIEWHEGRRIKTLSSVRLVPLLGDALVAAQEAVELAGEDGMLFSAYAREGGPDSASAALAKHVRNVVKRPKVTAAHSLRHRMADLLDLAEVSERDRNLVLGHTKGEASEGYGGEAARLEVAKRALTAALAAAATRP